MIDILEYKGEYYPLFQASGFAARFAFPFAKEVCKGIGYDIGCNRPEWCLENAIPIDKIIHDEWEAMNLPPQQVDFIFSSHCLEHLPNWCEALDYWLEHIKKGGVLFLYLPHRSQKYWLPFNDRKHIHFFDEDIIREYLQNKEIKKHFISGIDLNNSFTIIIEKQ